MKLNGSIDLEKFVDELIKKSGEHENGFVSAILIKMRHRYGTVGAIKKLVASKEMQKGFKRLAEINLLDHSIEAAVLEFPNEFTYKEVEAARMRIEKVKNYVALKKRGSYTS